MRYAIRAIKLAFWAAAAAFVLAASAASAQTYPPGVGSLFASVSDSAPAPGSTVDVSGSTFDSAGHALAGVEVKFTITSNPGSARFSNGQETISATTDQNGVGVVALNTGSEPGTIVIRVEAAGLVSQVTVTTGPPQALPQTGGFPEAGGTAPSMALVIGLVVLAATLFAAGGIAVRRRLTAYRR